MQYKQDASSTEAGKNSSHDVTKSQDQFSTILYGLENWNGFRYVEGIETSTVTSHDGSFPSEENTKTTLGYGDASDGEEPAVWVTTSTSLVDDLEWLFEIRFSQAPQRGGLPPLSGSQPPLESSPTDIKIDGKPNRLLILTDGKRWIGEIRVMDCWITLAAQNVLPEQISIVPIVDMSQYREGSSKLIAKAMKDAKSDNS